MKAMPRRTFVSLSHATSIPHVIGLLSPFAVMSYTRVPSVLMLALKKSPAVGVWPKPHSAAAIIAAHSPSRLIRNHIEIIMQR